MRPGDSDAGGDAGGLPIHTAVERGDVETAARLLAAEPELLRARTPDGDQPLHLACWQKNLEMARLLVERGADVNARGDFGKTPLHYAVYEGGSDSLPLIELLLAAGADVNARDDLLLQNPLGWAVREQHEELEPGIRLLRERGAELDLEGAALLADLDRVDELLRKEDPGLPPERVREIGALARCVEQLDRGAAGALGLTRAELETRARIAARIEAWLRAHDRG